LTPLKAQAGFEGFPEKSQDPAKFADVPHVDEHMDKNSTHPHTCNTHLHHGSGLPAARLPYMPSLTHSSLQLVQHVLEVLRQRTGQIDGVVWVPTEL